MQPLTVSQDGRKIVLLISSMNAGGAERVAATLANNWVDLGHEVRIVPCFSQGSGRSFYDLDPRVNLHWLAEDLPKNKLLNRLLKPFALRRKLKAWQPDVVVSFLTNVNVTALLATGGLDIPVIVCERTNPLSESHLPWLLRKLRKALYPKASAVMMQTAAAAKDYGDHMPSIKQIPAIANPIAADLMEELNALEQPESVDSAELENNIAPKVLLTMGRLVDLKQFGFLIDCFAAVAKDYPQWQLHIYGSGPLHTALQQQIEHLSLSERVILKGATKTPWQAMRQADAFAMSSEREGFPNVLLEAMANALPAIAIDCSYGPAELSRNGEVAILVPHEMKEGVYTQSTRDAFINGIRSLFGDKELRQHLSQAGQQHVLQNYSQQKVIEDWEALFQSLAVKRGATAQQQDSLRVVHLISGLGHGGAESVLFRLAAHAKKDQHIVLSMQDGGVFTEKFAAAGVELHCLNMPAGKISPRDFWRLGKKLKQLKPDVVQCWMYHADMIGGLAARLAGVKPVLWGVRNSGDNLAKSSRSSYMLARYFSWTSYFIPRLIVVCAELAAKRHQAWGYKASKIRVIPNGYDLSRWQVVSESSRNHLREGLGLAANDEVIAFVARWNPLKDHPNLLSAFAELKTQRPEVKLVLIGEGLSEDNTALMARLEQDNLGVGSDVLLLGRREDVPELMPAFDLHVLASMAEGFPNVVAESMACGVPNVVTDVGDAAFIVGDYGWVVPPKNATALASAVNKALDFLTTPAASEFKEQCRLRVVENFSLEKMIQHYEETWREALEK